MIVFVQISILIVHGLLFSLCAQKGNGGNNMTDWWSNASVILSGIITAIASIGAVVYTNFKTKKQLDEQGKKHEDERKAIEKQNSFVIIKPSYRLVNLTLLLDSLIISNDYNRVLLFSGEDGFDFFDDLDKQSKQTLRMLFIENKSGHDIKNITLTTNSELINIDTSETTTYRTNNALFLLRNGESIVIRLNNQEQFDRILYMNKNKCPSDLNFECTIEYDTMASQTVKYVYKINIRNDRIINVISDGIISVTDSDEKNRILSKQTCFRNLQDNIATIDRSEYAWRKMSNTQLQTFLSYFQMNQHNTTSAEEKKPDEK